MRPLMTLDHEVDEKRTRQQLRWLQTHPEYWERLAPRMQRYLPYILHEVSKEPTRGVSLTASDRERLGSLRVFSLRRQRSLAIHATDGKAVRVANEQLLRWAS